LSNNSTHLKFGKYEVIEQISAGGMAEVFKTRVDGLGGFHRFFALKRVNAEHADNPEYVDMLIEEAKIAGLLSHANIVQIVDLGERDEQPYIVMEYINGPDLNAVLKRLKERDAVLPIPHAIFIGLELLKALEYAHDRQVMRGGRPVPLDIIHRDVCPSNVLLSLKGEVKLTDFGIAKASVRNLDTVTGIVKGRFDYLSPEQTRGDSATQRSDIFAAGVLLYEMITGRHPFAQANHAKTIEAIKKASYVPAVAFNPEVPPAIDRLLSQTLTADPTKRFGSATALKDALDRFFHEAGYIFSSATLAAYLRGLFPDLGDLPRDDDTEADEHQETRPFLRGERPISAVAGRVDTEEMPTSGRPRELSVLDTLSLNRPLTALDTSLSGFFGPVDDENTIVDQKKGDPAQWPELDTVIRPIIETPSDDPNKRALAETRISGASTQTGERPVIRRRHKQSKNSKRRPLNPQLRRAQVLSLAIGVVIVVVALLVGFGLGNRAARLTGQPVNVISIPSDPRLEVHTPEGATLSIDGREVAGTSPHTVTITPDQSHIVLISRVGYYPVEVIVNLRKNDVRVLTVEDAKQHKKQR
jgi:serine/threonine protein kinase